MKLIGVAERCATRAVSTILRCADAVCRSRISEVVAMGSPGSGHDRSGGDDRRLVFMLSCPKSLGGLALLLIHALSFLNGGIQPRLRIAHTRRDGTWRGQCKGAKRAGRRAQIDASILLHVRRGSLVAPPAGVARPSRTAHRSSACRCSVISRRMPPALSSAAPGYACRHSARPGTAHERPLIARAVISLRAFPGRLHR
jgi:hypothetical protein